MAEVVKVCDGRCVFPQDLVDGYFSTDPVYPDPACSLHGIQDESCGCAHCNPDIPVAAYNEGRQSINRLWDLLEATGNALKGEPDDLSLHDWSDLAEVAVRLKAALVDLVDAVGHADGLDGGVLAFKHWHADRVRYAYTRAKAVLDG